MLFLNLGDSLVLGGAASDALHWQQESSLSLGERARVRGSEAIPLIESTLP